MKRTIRTTMLWTAFMVCCPLWAIVTDTMIAAAEKGDRAAQCAVGVGYLNKGDAENGAKWLRLAAERGDVDAQVALGVALMYDHVLKKDLVEAEQWLTKAAKQGSDSAKAFLEVLRTKDDATEPAIRSK